DGYKIELAYKTECISENEIQVEDEEGNTDSFMSKEWQSSLITDQKQNQESLQEYFKTSSTAEDECRQWLKTFQDKEEGYLNDVMLAALHVMAHAENSRTYLLNHTDIYNDALFSSDLLPSVEIFHGMKLSENYYMLRQKVLESAYNRVIQKQNGTEDIAKYILYRGTVLAQSQNRAEREKNLIENRGLNELVKLLEEKAQENKTSGNACTAYSVTAFASAFFCPCLTAVGASMAVLAITYYDKAESFSETAKEIARLSESKKQLVTNAETEKNNQIEIWLKKRAELEKQKSILEKMTGEDKSAQETELDYTAYINGLMELSSDITLEKITSIISEDIFIKAVSQSEKSIIKATNQIIIYLEKQQEASLQKVSDRAEDLRAFQIKAIQDFNEALAKGNINNLDEYIKSAMTGWNEIQHIKMLSDVNLKLFDSYTDSKNPPENYTFILQQNISQKIIEAMNIHIQNELSAAELKWQQQAEDLQKQQENWTNQINSVKNLSSSEWKKAEEKLNAKYNLWSQTFTENYTRLSNEWTESYLSLLKDKEDWILAEYTGSSVFEIEDAIKASVEKIKKTESLTSNTVEEYLQDILDTNLLNTCENIFNSLDFIAQDVSTQQIFTSGYITVQSEDEIKAEQAVKEMTKTMEAVATKCAA
ncbi:MAG: hypothetical protein IKZ04_06435, partial [Spirochaetaceae bacterium]|nr:hypothetical protein [Spirochaetaceae bacterium]